MARIRLKIHSWLIRDFESGASNLIELPFTTSEGETLEALVSRLALEGGVFRASIFAEESNLIRENVLVILNGVIVQPGVFFRTKISENDEIEFLPLLTGG